MTPYYTQSESTCKPLLIEIVMNTVYLRKDISEASRTDLFGNTLNYYTYQEAKMTIQEFNDYANIINTNNFIKVLTGQENADINQITIMEAIADMYEAVVSAAM